MTTFYEILSYTFFRTVGGAIATFLAYEMWLAALPNSSIVAQSCAAYTGFWLGWLSTNLFFADLPDTMIFFITSKR